MYKDKLIFSGSFVKDVIENLLKKALILACLFSLTGAARAETGKSTFTLTEAISFAFRNNPGIRISEKEIDLNTLGISTAKAAKMPRIDFTGGASRYRYPAALTPISGSPLAGTAFPEFDDRVYDFGVIFRLPLYRGGRLDRGVSIAEIQKFIAEDVYTWNKQDLAFNITSLAYKISQLEKLLEAAEASNKQMREHKKNVERFLEAGTAARIDLMKTELELSRTQEKVLLTANRIEEAYGLLKRLMGMDYGRKIRLVHEPHPNGPYPSFEESLDRAFARRPDYLAVLRKQRVTEEKVKIAEGKKLPDIYLAGEYFEKAGERFDFQENWQFALRLAIPVFDAGLINTEVKQGQKEAEKVREEERALKLAISQEIKDAYLMIENASQRIAVTEKAVATATETLRIEMLKYLTGAGTSTDVIDAETALLDTETAYHQAVCDNKIAAAALKRAVGEDIFKEVAAK